MTAFQRDKARASGSKRELSGSTVVYTLILEQGSIITNPSTWPKCLRRKRTRYRRCLEEFRYDWLDDVVSAVSVLSPKSTLNDIMTSTVLLPVRSAAPPIRNSGLARHEAGETSDSGRGRTYGAQTRQHTSVSLNGEPIVYLKLKFPPAFSIMSTAKHCIDCKTSARNGMSHSRPK
jgi:hypothetical protein